MGGSGGFLVAARRQTDAPTQSHVPSSPEHQRPPHTGWWGGLVGWRVVAAAALQEAPGGRSRPPPPPGEMNDFKSWVEMQMEDRRFKGEFFFLETRIWEEAYWP